MAASLAIPQPVARIFFSGDGRLQLLTDRRVAPQLDLVEDLDRLSDEDLMVRYRDGGAAAFDVLVLRHRGRIFSFLRRMVRDAQRAEELLSDVFLKLHRAAPRYRPEARFTTYLYTIAYRVGLNALDRQRNRRDRGVGGLDELDRLTPVVDQETTRSPERMLRTHRAMDRLEDELGRLPASQQAAFILYYREGLSCAEAAECLGISAAEVKGRLAYARKLLRERLSGFLDEGGGDLS